MHSRRARVSRGRRRDVREPRTAASLSPRTAGLEGSADGGIDLPVNGRLEGATDGGGLEGLMASGLATIPPNSHADLQWAMVG